METTFMDVGVFIRGVFFGLLIAVPVGPIGVLCIKRALVNGPLSGLSSGLGVAVADALGATASVLGLTLISSITATEREFLHIAGGLVLCFLGLKIFFSDPPEPAQSEGYQGHLANFLSTFLLTISNPVTISSFVAILAAFGVGAGNENSLLRATLIAGVFLGSSLWWIFLALGFRPLSERLDHQGIRWVGRVSGAIITGFGFVILLNP